MPRRSLLLREIWRVREEASQGCSSRFFICRTLFPWLYAMCVQRSELQGGSIMSLRGRKPEAIYSGMGLPPVNFE